jgi:uncharacterized membrane protein
MSDVAATTFYRALMWAGSWWCHQLPARSPHLWGSQLPLCWRCTGIAAGALLLLIWLFTKKNLPPLRLSFWLALLMPLDVLHAVISGGQGGNTRRLLTGVLWGIFGTTLALHLMKRAVSWYSTARPSARA